MKNILRLTKTLMLQVNIEMADVAVYLMLIFVAAVAAVGVVAVVADVVVDIDGHDDGDDVVAVAAVMVVNGMIVVADAAGVEIDAALAMVM